MSASSIVAVALKALRRNLFRTILTMVGMAVGVAAVITIVALGSGAQTADRGRFRLCGRRHRHTSSQRA
jgi:putative ABC transport system permease protein